MPFKTDHYNFAIHQQQLWAHTPVSFPSVGDPHLLPVNNILIAHFFGSCFDASHVRSCPGLSDTVRLQKPTQELNWEQQHRLSLHVCCCQHTVVRHRVYGPFYKINKAWRYNKKHSELPCCSKSPTQTNFPSFVTIYSIKGINKQTWKLNPLSLCLLLLGWLLTSPAPTIC